MTKKRTNGKVENKSESVRGILKGRPQATIKEVQAELQSRGLKVSDALIAKIKYGRKGATAKQKAGGHKKSSKRGSKADAIRGAWQELGLDARPRDVVAGLASKGVKVTPAQVSTLRKKLSGRRVHKSEPGNGVSFDHLMAAKALANRLGGVATAQRALEKLARLLDN